VTGPGAPLTASHLSKVYNGRAVVDDVSFELEPGTVTGFVGPNGAGKSTTLRMILGLTQPSGGSATVGGRPYRELGDPTRTVGAVLESNDFHPARSGRDHLRVLAAQAAVDTARVDDLLGVVGLADHARRVVGSYSLGMRQRLGLAGALLGEPSVLVLDEPANGLDPTGIHWLRRLLRDFAAQGGTVLVSSHLLSELARTIDRVLVLVDGRVRADAAITDLQTDGQSLEDVYLGLVTAATP
jgi:ABC-2 type transport system ATP-binding protein